MDGAGSWRHVAIASMTAFEPGAERQVLPVGLRLFPGGHLIPDRHRAAPKALQLREHEPHPVAFLGAGDQLRPDHVIS